MKDPLWYRIVSSAYTGMTFSFAVMLAMLMLACLLAK